MMQMATRVSEKAFEHIESVPAVKAVEGAPLSGAEFFGENGSGLLLQFGGSRLEIMCGADLEASREGEPLAPGALRAALASSSGKPVTRVRVERGRALTIDFAGGLRLTVSLRGDSRTGLESAAYYDEAWRYEAY